MAISFVAGSTNVTANDSFNVALPTGWAAGDLLLLFVEDAGVALSASAGWTALAASPQNGTGTSLFAWYRVAQSGDSSVTVSGSNVNHMQAALLAYRGVDNTTPIDVTPVGGTHAASSSATTGTSITTVTDNCMVAVAFVAADDTAAGNNWRSYANSNLDSLTEREDLNTAIGNDGSLGVADGVKVTAGAVGATTVTNNQGAAYAYMTVALRPSAGAPPPTTYDSCGVLVAF